MWSYDSVTPGNIKSGQLGLYWEEHLEMKDTHLMLITQATGHKSVMHENFFSKGKPISKTIPIISVHLLYEPITAAAQSKAWTVYARSNTGIVGSNPTQGMDVCIVCVYSMFVLFCV
jgi:hypothetical protein